jgi:hypothetical protein
MTFIPTDLTGSKYSNGKHWTSSKTAAREEDWQQPGERSNSLMRGLAVIKSPIPISSAECISKNT